MLMLAPQPFFSPRGTPLSVYHRARVLAEQGVEIDLLTYGEGQDVDLPGVRIRRIPRLPWLEPVPIGPSPSKLLLDVVLAVYTVALLLWGRYRVVHAHEEAIFLARALRPFFRFRLIYDMHSSLPRQLENFPYGRLRPLVALFEVLEDWCLTGSDAVITICPALGRRAEARLQAGGPEALAKHLVIENSLFDPVKRRGAPTASAVPVPPTDRPRILYAGSFEGYQGLDLLLDAFHHLLPHPSRPRLVLAGGLPHQVDRYRERAAALGLAEDVEFLGRLPQEAVRAWLEGSAVVVSPRLGGENTPLKIYELLDAGIPLVATRVLSHTQVLDDSVSWLAETEPQALADALADALEHGPTSPRPAAARDLYRRRYDPHAYRAKIAHLLERVR
jgi:glycosyltransferase involved in cell wall biosynthesis